MAKQQTDQQNLQANKAFFDRWSKSYDFCPLKFWMKNFQLPALNQIQFRHGIKILDLSCGTGELLRTLYEKSKGKAQLSGLDLSKEMLEKARRKVPKEIALVQGDVHHLPFDEKEFNYVLCTEAFHHYHSQKKAVSEMKRVLKDDGKIIIVDVNFFLRPIHWLFQKIEPGCVKINNKREMKQLFKDNDLNVIKQKRNFLFAIMTIGEKEFK